MILVLTYIVSSISTIYLGNTGVFFSSYTYAVSPPKNTFEPRNQTATAQSYNSTDTMISSFRSGNKLLMQAINDIKTGNTHKALSELDNAKVQIEQQQLAALDVMSNPVLQLAREHLLAAKHYIESGNIDGAVSELVILRQLKILHQQGMMTMRLPMTRDLNSTFNSAETHLLAAGEALNAYDPQRAISELDIASEQLYSHQLAMLDVINSLFSDTRAHFQQSINDIKANDTKQALSDLNKVISSLDEDVQGVLMIKGLPSTAVISTNRVNVTTS